MAISHELKPVGTRTRHEEDQASQNSYIDRVGNLQALDSRRKRKQQEC